jgi:uncharacterized repeat protein (TIGR03803 family)
MKTRKQRITLQDLVLATVGAASISFLASTPGFAAQASVSLVSSFAGSDPIGQGRGAFGNLQPVGSGKFYGFTSIGGSYGYGNIYEFDSSSGTIISKAEFNISSGSPGYGALVPLPNGNYLGTTSNGSSQFRGVIFEFDPLLGLITTKAEFDGTTMGLPTSAPISIGGNKFIGLTNIGGTAGFGTIYEYDSSNFTLTHKASFGVAEGKDPGTALVKVAGTDLFLGTTTAGGANGYGSVYEYNIATGIIKPRAAFDAAIGSPSYANSGLISVGAGKYIGTAPHGGVNGAGAVYEFDSNTNGLTLLNSFDFNAYYPLGELLNIGNNNFLGATLYGAGASLGAVYRYDLNLNQFFDIAQFPDDESVGILPFSALSPGRNGNYYGVTSGYGTSIVAGTIYSYTPTPGPVPLFGAAAAYSWSRKLRRRIVAQV